MSIIVLAVIVAFTGFGALIVLTVGSMLFAAVPAAMGWLASALTNMVYRRR